jgi:purine-binding chemotaxis protein CheW
VPGSPDAVLGLMNLRGLIITAVDLRQRMGLTPLADHSTATSIVVRSDDAPVSLLVDRIGDVVAVANVPFEAPPDTLAGPARDLITGAYKLDDLLLLELDTSRAIADLTASAV